MTEDQIAWNRNPGRRKIVLIRARTPQEIKARSPVRVLGLISHQSDGWRFMSLVASHGNSRRGWAQWQNAIPRWTGGLDRTESFYAEPGQTLAEAISAFLNRQAVTA
jgi:hypothetical protein